MNSWDFIANNFIGQNYIRIIFLVKNLPIIGKYAKNGLFNHLSYVYDVVSTYLLAHKHVEEIFHDQVIIHLIKGNELFFN